MIEKDRTLRVTCAIIHKDDKILVTQRSEKMSQPFKWEFPGGKMEEGENAEDCIQRELMEELSIHVTIKGTLKEVICNYPGTQVVLIPFIADLKSGNITLTEHMNYSWLTRDELKNLNWSLADIAVVEQYLIHH